MEADEIKEFTEQMKEGGESGIVGVSLATSVLVGVGAMITVLGHRSHTQAVLAQARASDQWNLYQAKKIRQYNTELTADLLSALPIRDAGAANKVTDSYKSHHDKWNEDLTEEENKARELESEVRKSERHGDRFD